MKQTVLHRKFILRSAASLKSHLSKHQAVHSFLGGWVEGCAVQPNWEVDLRSLHVAYRKLFSSWQCGRRGGGGSSRTINREEFKLKGSERKGSTCQK